MSNGNGQTFAEIREIIAEEKEITVKGALRLILAALDDMKRGDEKDRQEIKKRLEDIEAITKYPSALWFLINRTWKTLAVFTFIGVVMGLVFIPEFRGWASEQIIKTLLGGL